MIESRIDSNKLKIRILGKKKPGFGVELISEDYQELPYKIIEKEDETIPEGTVKVDVPARVGFEITTVRLFKQDGKVTKREVLDHDRIDPRDKIVLIPPKPKDQPLPESETLSNAKSEPKNAESTHSTSIKSSSVPTNEPATESQPPVEVNLGIK
jgi:hypothetical protein